MRKRSLLLLALLLLMLMMFGLLMLAGGLWLAAPHLANLWKPAPPTVEILTDDLGITPQLKAALASDHAQEDSRYFAAVFAAAAERLEADGQQKEPVIRQRIQLESFIQKLGSLATRGKTQGRYPEFPGVAAELFAEHLPRQQGELTAADRAQAVRCFRALAAGCQAVAGGGS